VDAGEVAALCERIDALQAAVKGLSEQNTQLAEERERYRAPYLQMLELNKKLERGLLGQKAEKLPPDQAQLTLQLLGTLLGESEEAEPSATESVQEIGRHTRRKPTGRKLNLPRSRRHSLYAALLPNPESGEPFPFCGGAGVEPLLSLRLDE